MSLLRLFIAGIIALCILVLGGLIVIAIIGFSVSFVELLEANPVLKGLFVLLGLVLIIGLFLAFSKWVLGKAV